MEAERIYKMLHRLATQCNKEEPRRFTLLKLELTARHPDGSRELNLQCAILGGSFSKHVPYNDGNIHVELRLVSLEGGPMCCKGVRVLSDILHPNFVTGHGACRCLGDYLPALNANTHRLWGVLNDIHRRLRFPYVGKYSEPKAGWWGEGSRGSENANSNVEPRPGQPDTRLSTSRSGRFKPQLSVMPCGTRTDVVMEYLEDPKLFADKAREVCERARSMNPTLDRRCEDNTLEVMLLEVPEDGSENPWLMATHKAIKNIDRQALALEQEQAQMHGQNGGKPPSPNRNARPSTASQVLDQYGDSTIYTLTGNEYSSSCDIIAASVVEIMEPNPEAGRRRLERAADDEDLDENTSSSFASHPTVVRAQICRGRTEDCLVTLQAQSQIGSQPALNIGPERSWRWEKNDKDGYSILVLNRKDLSVVSERIFSRTHPSGFAKLMEALSEVRESEFTIMFCGNWKDDAMRDLNWLGTSEGASATEAFKHHGARKWSPANPNGATGMNNKSLQDKKNVRAPPTGDRASTISVLANAKPKEPRVQGSYAMLSSSADLNEQCRCVEGYLSAGRPVLKAYFIWNPSDEQYDMMDPSNMVELEIKDVVHDMFPHNPERWQWEIYQVQAHCFRHRPVLTQIFQHYAVTGGTGSNPESMGLRQWKSACRDGRLSVPGCASAVDDVFRETNFEGELRDFHYSNKSGGKTEGRVNDEDNPDRELVLDEFFESVARMGARMYKNQGIGVATKLAFEEHLIKHAARIMVDDEFDEAYNTREVLSCVSQFRLQIQRHFKAIVDPISKMINASRWIDFVKSRGLIGTDFTLSKALLLFVLTVRDGEVRDLNYETFVEVITRVAITLHVDRESETLNRATIAPAMKKFLERLSDRNKYKLDL